MTHINLPWYTQTIEGRRIWLAYTIAGTLRLVPCVAPWYKHVKPIMGYSVMLGTKRIGWTVDLSDACNVGMNTVKETITRRFQNAVRS